MTDGSGRNREIVTSLILALMTGRRNVAELRAISGMHDQAIRKWLEIFRARGLVRYVEFRHVAGQTGSYPAVHEWQSTPFEKKDFES